MADNLDGQNPGGAPNGGGQAPGAGGNNTPQGNTPAGGGQAPVVGQEGGQPKEKVFSFKEDRTDWVPRTRLNEVSGRLTAIEKESLTLKEQLALAEKRTRALVGVEPIDPKSAETEEIRSAIAAMFPELEAIKGFSREQLQEILEAARSAQNTSKATWERHALTMLTDLDAACAKSTGVEKLSPTQQKSLRRAYREEALVALQSRPVNEEGERVDQTGNDFLSRHERGDKTLITEFVKAFLNDWYEPARRSVTAATVQRGMRPVPRGERTRTPLTQAPPAIDYNDKNAFKKALAAARGGGQE